MNDSNFGGDLYKAVCVLDKIKAISENFLSKIQNFLGTFNSNNDEEVEILDDYFFLNDDIGGGPAQDVTFFYSWSRLSEF